MLAKETTTPRTKIRTITGFSAQVQWGYYVYERHASAGIVSSALTAVCQALSLGTRVNPLKIMGSKTILHQIQVMLDG